MFKRAALLAAAVLASAVLASAGLSAGTASAETAPPSDEAGTSADVFKDEGNFCVMYLPTGKYACVDAESEMGAARAEILIGADGITASPQAIEASWHIGTVYDNDQYNTGAGYFEFYTSADCTASKTDNNWQNANLAGIGWSNRISSFRSYGNCQTRLFSAVNFGGSAYPAGGPVAASPNVGTAMNDHAASIKWT